MDPDYTLPETIREEANKRREKEKLEQIEKAKAQIKEDFQKECDQRENQLLEIQNRITCLAKTLHVLRYVLVSNYYSKPQTQIQFTQPESTIIDKQHRLHPAVKKLVNEKDLASLDFSKKRPRRARQSIRIQPIQETNTEEKEEESAGGQMDDSSVREIVSSSNAAPRNRQMVKRQLIVGNISKWMPSHHPDDNSTHKWMVYVRGPQESPRIDDIVEKIIFHLHPSYHPHDVIEVTEHPYHLTRRGWGEFPIRCQIHFTNPLNKPVDIVHALILDKTHTGRQTLGGETVAVLTLYGEVKEEEEIDEDLTISQAISNALDIKEESPEEQMDLATLIDSMDFSSTVVPAGSSNEVLDQSLPGTTTTIARSNELYDCLNGSFSSENSDIDVMDACFEQPRKHTQSQDYAEFCPALRDHTYALLRVSS